MADADGFQLAQLLRQPDAEGIGPSLAEVISGIVQQEFAAGSQRTIEGDIDLRIRTGPAQVTGGDGNRISDRLLSIRDIRMNLALPMSRVQEAFERLNQYVFVD